jgi:hypothetical protein
MKTSYNSEHPLLERKKERKTEKKGTSMLTHTQEDGSQDTGPRNARLKDHKM